MKNKSSTASVKPFGGGRKALFRLIVIAVIAVVSMAAAAMLVDASHAGPPRALYFVIISCAFAAAFGGIAWFIRSLFSWKNFRRFLFGAACLLTMLVVILTEENIRGKVAWRRELERLQAKGESVDFHDFIPPQIPDDKNLAMIPLLQPLYDFKPGPHGNIEWQDTNGLSRLQAISIDAQGNGKKRMELDAGSLEKGALANIASCASFYEGNTNYPQAPASASPPEIILVALSKYNSEVKEIRNGSDSRADCRFSIHYEMQPPWSILLPHLATIRSLGRIFEMRGIAEIAATNSDAALRDFRVALCLSDAVSREPFLISHLVRIASLGTSLMIVQEGLGLHVLTPDELDKIGSALGGINLLAEYERCLGGERAFSVGGLEFLTRAGAKFDPNAILSDNQSGNILLKFMPSGWIYQNMTLMAQLHDEYTFRTVDSKAHRIYPDIAAAGKKALEHLHRSPNTIFVRLLMPSLEKAAMRSGRMQTYLDEARVACALEKFRIEHGSFPDELQKLVPNYATELPADLVDGKPLRYRKGSDGGYVLYSIGWNQKDDGGATAIKQNSKNGSIDETEGDWVWKMPATTTNP
jgi:hypothetical protein